MWGLLVQVVATFTLNPTDDCRHMTILPLLLLTETLHDHKFLQELAFPPASVSPTSSSCSLLILPAALFPMDLSSSHQLPNLPHVWGSPHPRRYQALLGAVCCEQEQLTDPPCLWTVSPQGSSPPVLGCRVPATGVPGWEWAGGGAHAVSILVNKGPSTAQPVSMCWGAEGGCWAWA